KKGSPGLRGSRAPVAAYASWGIRHSTPEAGGAGSERAVLSLRSVLYVWASFDGISCPILACSRDGPAALGGRLPVVEVRPDADFAAGGALPARRDGAGPPAVRRGATEFPEDRRAAPELGLRGAGPFPRRRGVLPRGGVRQGGEGVRGVPGILSSAPDRRSRPGPARHELLRPDEAVRAGPGSDGESNRTVPQARKGVPGEPIRHRRPREDRRVPGPARAEGTVGRDLLLQPRQSEHRPPAAGAGAEGLSANARDPRDALLAGRGELLRGQGGGGQRAAPPPVRGIRVHRVGPAGPRSAAGSKVIAVHDIVDLRSDTLTLPTPEMREAMARAQVGDDVWEEDPTVQRLEAMSAECLGKEAGLFVASGTMGNLVSVLSHTQAGQEVVLAHDAHIFNCEVAGAAGIGGVQLRPVKPARGFPAPAQAREALRPPNTPTPPPGLVCVENPHNRHGGTCCTPEE